MRQSAKAAVVDARLQFPHRGMKAAGIGDAEHDAGARHRIERAGGAVAVERERLLHKDVLAR